MNGDPFLSELAIRVEGGELDESRRIGNRRGNEKDVRSFRVLAGISEGDGERGSIRGR